jgi:hypothetical protein
MSRVQSALICSLFLSLPVLGGCPDDPVQPQPWQAVALDVDQALMGVGGTGTDDVWAVGATRTVQDPEGPLVLQWNGSEWRRHVTGQLFDLWWVHAFRDGPVFIGGAGGTILRHTRDTAGTFERMATPGLAAHTVYGVWGPAPDDVWAVGGIAGRSCFVWHWNGQSWRDVRMPGAIPKDAAGEIPACLKVWGRGSDEVYVVGSRGLVMRGRDGGNLEVVSTATNASIFTVHGNTRETFMVGGASQGAAFDFDGTTLADRSPPQEGLLQGVCASDDHGTFAVGVGGSVFERVKSAWRRIDTGILFTAQSLHAVWIDPEGGVWAVGGNVLSSHLNQGAILYRPASAKAAIPATYQSPPPVEPPEPTCPENAIDRAPNGSIARRWNEQMLGAIARDVPRPVVHARNLFHVSAALFDTWAAFGQDDVAQVFADERAPEAIAASEAARAEAMSHAAYRVLLHRYGNAVGGPVSKACFRTFMDRLGYDPDATTLEGDTPAAIGNRIGQRIIDLHVDDGANEANNYADTTGYKSNNPPMVVDVPGVRMTDVTEWQLMNIAVAETQNGLILDGGVQGYIGAQWGGVTPFALQKAEDDDFYVDIDDIGHPPQTIDDLRDGAVRLLAIAARLDPTADDWIDISPGVYGNSTLGTDDLKGHPVNPATGQPYAENRIRAGDFFRVMSEYWADGPATETPPGHWNSIANQASDHPDMELKLFGEGEPVERLEWDVKMYVSLNGAMHDAAIVAWGLKRIYLGARPISIIRWLGQNGQSSDPNLPSYHEDGLPIVPGLIELITAESSAPGERHAHLHPWIGEIAVRSWRGEPGDRKKEIGGVGWIRVKEWMPFQRRTFVTPAFPGYVSGHSTYSRAGAEVLTRFTGDAFFPGGVKTYTYRKGAFLFFETGPSEDIEIQWATYYDAADQSGRSRISGGIHIDGDDYPGRRAGAIVGGLAVEKARRFWEGAPAVPAR